MLSINTNLSSIIAQNSMRESTNALNQAIERMSTGFKINHAKDNAANYSITTNMTTKIGSYQIAEENCAMGLDLVTTASSTLDLVSEHVQRIRDLCEQASNGTYGEQSLKAIQSEIDARQQEVDRILAQTEYNGIKLFESEQATPATFATPRAGSGVTGSFIEEVDQLTEEEAIAQGYTVIKTADELQAMQNNLSGKYILMNDVDLDGYSWASINNFKGELNGNGYVIKNLTSANGLFSSISWNSGSSAKICNLGVENATINGNSQSTGILVGSDAGDNTTYDNCYVTGTVTSTASNASVGGLIGNKNSSNGDLIQNCWADVVVNSTSNAGGLIGFASYTTSQILNCYTKGSVTGKDAGGLVGYACGIEVSDSYSLAQVSGATSNGGIFGYVSGLSYTSTITNTYWDTSIVAVGIGTTGDNVTGTPAGLTTAELQALIDNGTLPKINPLYEPPVTPNVPTGSPSSITLQVGINGDSNSQITFGLATTLTPLGITITDSDTARDSLTIIDNYLSQISNYQTSFGAVQNRLESALEEISVQYDNLVSSRSTLRDADIAEESSKYIQAQILQQASATLMSTANQSPSIALQLI